MTEEQIKQKAQENAGSVSNFDLNITLMVAENKIDAYRLGRNDGFIDGYHEGFKDCAKSRLNVTTISDCPIKDEEESKYKTAYIKGIRTMANALKDYDRTEGVWTDYFEHTVEEVLKRLLKESK